MIIEDNPGIMFVMKRALERKNYSVRAAYSLANIRTTAKGSPNLIFLDYSVSAKDRKAVLRELKNSKVTKGVPVVLLTGYSNARELAIETGADSYLMKPFTLTQLWKKTAQYSGVAA